MWQLLFNTFAFLLFVPIFPILLIFFVTLLLYRAVIKSSIKLFVGSRFKGFLEGMDAIWNVETNSSRSMINVFLFIEAPSNIEHGKIPGEFLRSVRETIADKLMGKTRPHPRLFFTRNETLGYSYWTDDCKLSVNDFVRFMEPIETKGDFIDADRLRETIGRLCNVILPNNHTTCWELLIGAQPTKGVKPDTVRYPILLRYHHSVGDGMVILRLILDTITGNHAAMSARLASGYPETPFGRKKSASNLLQLVKILFNGPAFLLRTLFHKSEKNCFSGGKITDYKVVSWLHEPEVSGDAKTIIETIKSTKQIVSGARFSDIYLVALSSSLHKYFESKGEPYPDGGVSVIVPGRAGSEAKSLKIKNRYTTRRQMIKLSQGIQLDDPDRLAKLRQKISLIAKDSVTTRTNSSHAVISQFISFLTDLLPSPLLRLLVSNFHTNLVFSMLPEVEKVAFQGYELVGPTLLLPNTGSIAVGIAAVTFADRVHLGILVDRSVIPSETEAHSILEGIVSEIERMAVVLQDIPKQSAIRFEVE